MENDNDKSVKTKIFVVGDKPTSKRKIYLLFLLAVGTLAGNGIATVLEKTGVYTETFSYFKPIDEKTINSIGVFEEKTQWVEHDYPWINIGKTENGYDLIKMMDAWLLLGDGKIKESDIFYIYNQTQFMAPTLVGRNDPQLIKEIKEEALLANLILNEKYPELAMRLKEHFKGENEFEHSENNTDRTILYSFPSYIYNVYSENQDIDYSYSQAKFLLEKTVQITGLKSLQMPLQYWNDPNHLAMSAGLLLNANNDLKERSGLGGRALGMDGRINLRLKNPTVNFMNIDKDEGTIHMSTTGIMFLKPTGIFIDSSWNSIFHEVGHAYDFMVSVNGYKNASIEFFSESNTGIFRQSNYPGFVSSARMMRKKIDPEKNDLGIIGHSIRYMAKETKNESYWLGGAEIFARTLEHYIEPKRVNLGDVNNDYIENIGREKMIGERTVEYFNEFFEIASNMNLTGSDYISFDSSQTIKVNKITDQTSFENYYLNLKKQNKVTPRKYNP